MVGEVDEYGFEVALDRPRGARPGALTLFARVTPKGELPGHRLLNRLAIGKIGGAARAGPDEVGLVEGQALGEPGRLDEAAHVLGRRGRDSEPVPPSLDDLAVGADRDPAAVLGESQRSLII